MDDFNIYYSRAAAFCSKTEKCSFDVKKKLLDWGAEEELAEKVLKKLMDEQFIDDARYASFFAKDKFKFNKWGRIKIAYLLRMKGIALEQIGAAIQEIDEEEYLDSLYQLLKTKRQKTSGKDKHDRQAKVLRFAQSHGFESEVVVNVLSVLEKEDQD